MKKILVSLLIITILFMCSGCGAPTPAETPEQVNTATGAEEKSYDSVLTVFAHKPDTLCPLLTSSESNKQMLQMVFDSLITLNENLSVEPCLATEWSVSEDGKFWTVNLRSDVKWHDGSQFEAGDVVYTVNQIKNNEESLFFYNVSNIAEVRAKEQFTVEFELNSPWVNFINLLYFPVVKENGNGINAETFSPVGTGPYVFNNKKEDSKYHLLRNDNWWGGTPVTECIEVQILSDVETALYAFDAGDIDMIMSNDTDWGKFVDAEAASYKSVPSQELTFLGINHRRGALKNPEVRRSVSYAVNRQQMVDEIMLSCATATTTPANPNWTISENVELETKQNTEAAKAEFENNEWEVANGYWHKSVDNEYYTTVFKILYNEDNPEREAIAQLIEKNLEDVGIDVVHDKVSYDDYISRIQSGNYDMFLGSILISPELDFSFIMNEDNVFGFSNEEMSAMRESIRNGNSSEQATLYAPLIEKFHWENPIVSLFFRTGTLLHSKRVEGEYKTTVFDAYKGIENLQKKEAK